MSLICNSYLKIKCDKCGHIISIPCNELEFENVAAEEREMGPEITHSATGEVKCPNCGNDISYEYNVWEYPVGAFNTDEVNIEGGKLIEKCEILIDID